MRTGTVISGLVLGLAALATAPTAQTPPTAEQLAKQLQSHYDGVKDFTASFTQTFRGVALPQQTNELAAFGILFGGFVILTGYTSINALVKAQLFPTHVRALGVGLGYAVANSLFGGTAPLLYAGAQTTEQVPLFIVYVTVIIGASLLVYIFCLRNKAPNWLDDEIVMTRPQPLSTMSAIVACMQWNVPSTFTA